nr:uncharacterized mitochondrial protein AtMg00810-like [Tanacetum cinerariifolium]
MSSDTKLMKDEECESVDSTNYRGMIGSLLYLTGSRPDIMFSVCLCAQFQEAPKTSHLEAVKRFFRYIKGTMHLGLWYPKRTGIETVVYVDSDHVGDYVDRESISDIYTFAKPLLLYPLPKSNTDRWSLDELVYGAPSEGPYQTNIPSPDDIILYIQEDREGQVTRIRHHEEVKFNLAYFMAKRREWVTKQARLILPYGMLLTRLFDFIIDENPKLQNESYVLYDRVMNPLAAQLERKPRRDRGMTKGLYSTSSSTFNQPSSSHLNDDDDDDNDNDDDDDGNNEGTSCSSTPSPIQYVNSLTNEVPQVFQNPPKIDPHLEPFYTRQTEIINRQVQIRDEHHGGLRSIGLGFQNLWRNLKKK